MKKLIFSMALLCTTFSAFACDVCSVFSAIEPNSFKSRIGLTYRSSFYRGFPIIGLKHGGYQGLDVKEIYDYYELSGRYYNQKTRLGFQAVLPIVNRYRSVNSSTESDNWGFGDPKIQLTYRAINSKQNRDSSKIVHRLDVGIGIKAPLGLTNRATNGILSDIVMQPGSGSWDLIASLQYAFKIKSWGALIDATYQFNNNGRTGYHFGDLFSLKASAFYLWKKGDWAISPMLGLNFDLAMEDRNKGKLYYDSGGYVFGGSLGMNIYWKKFQVNGSFGVPFAQYYKGYETPFRYRFSVGLIYNI